MTSRPSAARSFKGAEARCFAYRVLSAKVLKVPSLDPGLDLQAASAGFNVCFDFHCLRSPFLHRFHWLPGLDAALDFQATGDGLVVIGPTVCFHVRLGFHS